MEPDVREHRLVLILAKELADKLATAMFVVDHEGALVYFNERAADILGVTFGEAGRMPFGDWIRDFAPRDDRGEPLPPDQMPLVIALQEKRPAHLAFRISGKDGKPREIAVTAFPLFARTDLFVGAAAIFWEHPKEVVRGETT